ncbi:hypothetical protein PAXRUDRAFT_160161, partial [Paxillus rubicundulus Ve08.2h10]
ELPLPVRSAKDMQYAVNWVVFCLVLHNMIIWFEERWYGEKSVQRKDLEKWERNEMPHMEEGDEQAGENVND